MKKQAKKAGLPLHKQIATGAKPTKPLSKGVSNKTVNNIKKK